MFWPLWKICALMLCGLPAYACPPGLYEGFAPRLERVELDGTMPPPAGKPERPQVIFTNRAELERGVSEMPLLPVESATFGRLQLRLYQFGRAGDVANVRATALMKANHMGAVAARLIAAWSERPNEKDRDQIALALEVQHDALMHYYSTYVRAGSIPSDVARQIASAIRNNLELAVELLDLDVTPSHVAPYGENVPSIRFNPGRENVIARFADRLRVMIPQRNIELHVSPHLNVLTGSDGSWYADGPAVLGSPYLFWSALRKKGIDGSTLHEVRHAYVDALEDLGINSPYHGLAWTDHAQLPGKYVGPAYTQTINFDEGTAWALNLHQTAGRWRRLSQNERDQAVPFFTEQTRIAEGISQRVALTNELAVRRLQHLLDRPEEVGLAGKASADRDPSKLYLGETRAMANFVVVTGASGVRRVVAEIVIDGRISVRMPLFGDALVQAAERLTASNRALMDGATHSMNTESYDALLTALRDQCRLAAETARYNEGHARHLRELGERITAAPDPATALALQGEYGRALERFSAKPIRLRPPRP